TTSSRRTPRAIMNWFAPPTGACGRMVARLARIRSVIASSAGDPRSTRAACDWVGRRKPAPSPSSRIGRAGYCRSTVEPGDTRTRTPVGAEVPVQLGERQAVHVALEVDHRIE